LYHRQEPGAFIPLELFPSALRKAIEFTPFPLLTSIPVKIFMGQEAGNFSGFVALTILWIAVFGAVATIVWRKGIRIYAAAGM
jgi:ABC-2 type transport system permease protein